MAPRLALLVLDDDGTGQALVVGAEDQVGADALSFRKRTDLDHHVFQRGHGMPHPIGVHTIPVPENVDDVARTLLLLELVHVKGPSGDVTEMLLGKALLEVRVPGENLRAAVGLELPTGTVPVPRLGLDQGEIPQADAQSAHVRCVLFRRMGCAGDGHVVS